MCVCVGVGVGVGVGVCNEKVREGKMRGTLRTCKYFCDILIILHSGYSFFQLFEKVCATAPEGIKFFSQGT